MTTLMTKPVTRLVLNGLFAVITLWLATVPPTQAATMASDFDHLATGFPLTGGHSRQECEACHLQGQFKGTPRQCERCHVQGSNRALTFKPNTHVQTTRPCDQCHTSNVTWLGARFDHVGVVPGGCPTCHNGVSQMGKPTSGHPVTTLPCDSCHRSTAWLPAYFDHNGVAAHDCTRCHDTGGQHFVQRPGNHIPLSAGTVIQCDWCHRAGTTWTVSTFNHAATQGVIPQQCTDCHNGVVGRADVAGAKHVPTTGSAGYPKACDTCHNTSAWVPNNFTHSTAQGVTTGGCNTCHSGAYDARGKGAGHPNNPAEASSCDACHTSYTAFTFIHPSAGLGSCLGCHGGGYAQALPPPPHPATGTESCDDCHKSFTAGWPFTHPPTGSACSTCHYGSGSATHPSGSHFPVTGVTGGACEACHTSTSSWGSTKRHGTSVTASQCNVCHRNSAYQGSPYNVEYKSSSHHGTTSCDASGCHSSTKF
jgi:hypothetical protein